MVIAGHLQHTSYELVFIAVPFTVLVYIVLTTGTLVTLRLPRDGSPVLNGRSAVCETH